MDENQLLQELSGQPVLEIFRQITAIPRATGQEILLGKWLISYAKERDWGTAVDTIGNVMLRIAATAGHEKDRGVCLQAHQDMVCIDDQGKIFGDEKFPLELDIVDGWLTAKGTTLGADNGIGLALALAVAENAEHGPLEILCTVQEEGGLDGAKQLDLAIRSSVMINLDSEDWQELFIGCAGGVGATIEMKQEGQSANLEQPIWHLTIDGLKGGHSGLEINQPRQNAIRLMAQVLKALNSNQNIRLISFNGGSRTNAIPSTAEAYFIWPADKDKAMIVFNTVRQTLEIVLDQDEPDLNIVMGPETWEESETPHIFGSAVLEPVEWCGSALSTLETSLLLDTILELPNGVVSMSPVPDIPQTSLNTGVIEFDVNNARMTIRSMLRSSDTGELHKLKDRLTDYCGNSSLPLKISFSEGYPGWQPNPDSELVNKVTEAWLEFSETELHVTAVHAGLECGLILEKFPNLQIVSLGPDIRGAHSADEKVNLDSVQACYAFLMLLLSKLG